MSTFEHRCALAKAFVEDMKSRGIERIDDEAVRYHLVLLLKPEGHPTIKVTPSESVAKEIDRGSDERPRTDSGATSAGSAVSSGPSGVVSSMSASPSRDGTGRVRQQHDLLVREMPTSTVHGNASSASRSDAALEADLSRRPSEATSPKPKFVRYEHTDDGAEIMVYEDGSRYLLVDGAAIRLDDAQRSNDALTSLHGPTIEACIRTVLSHQVDRYIDDMRLRQALAAALRALVTGGNDR